MTAVHHTTRSVSRPAVRGFTCDFARRAPGPVWIIGPDRDAPEGGRDAA